MSEVHNNRFDGTSSIGLPGIQGVKGMRPRIFFYGNEFVDITSEHKKIYFSTSQSDFNTDKKNEYAVILDDSFTPEEYDYIIYTTKKYDYILLILKIKKDGDDYIAIVKKIDEIDLTKKYNSDDITTVNLNFNINTIIRQQKIPVRDPLNTKIGIIEYRDIRQHSVTDTRPFKWPKTTIGMPVIKTINSDLQLVDITLVIPSNSDYVFDSNIKITLEIYSNQSFIMDSTIADKFLNNTTDSNIFNTHRGCYQLYKQVEPKDIPNSRYVEYVKKDINFDDERMENFIFVIKDYEDGVGSKALLATSPLMLSSLKRIGSNPEAYLVAYIQNGNFIEKFIIDKFDLSFINKTNYISNSNVDFEWNKDNVFFDEDNHIKNIDNDIESISPYDKLWTCPHCGATGNIGDCCSACGEPKAHPTWTCSCCGATNPVGTDICSECGNIKDACIKDKNGLYRTKPIVVDENDKDFISIENNPNEEIVLDNEYKYEFHLVLYCSKNKGRYYISPYWWNDYNLSGIILHYNDNTTFALDTKNSNVQGESIKIPGTPEEISYVTLENDQILDCYDITHTLDKTFIFNQTSYGDGFYSYITVTDGFACELTIIIKDLYGNVQDTVILNPGEKEARISYNEKITNKDQQISFKFKGRKEGLYNPYNFNVTLNDNFESNNVYYAYGE